MAKTAKLSKRLVAGITPAQLFTAEGYRPLLVRFLKDMEAEGVEIPHVKPEEMLKTLRRRGRKWLEANNLRWAQVAA